MSRPSTSNIASSGADSGSHCSDSEGLDTRHGASSPGHTLAHSFPNIELTSHGATFSQSHIEPILVRHGLSLNIPDTTAVFITLCYTIIIFFLVIISLLTGKLSVAELITSVVFGVLAIILSLFLAWILATLLGFRPDCPDIALVGRARHHLFLRTIAYVFLCISHLIALFLLAHGYGSTKEDLVVRTDSLSKARFPSVAILQTTGWPSQPELKGGTANCFLGSHNDEAPQCASLNPSLLENSKSCNCGELWQYSGNVVEDFEWANEKYRYIAFNSPTWLITKTPWKSLILEASFDYDSLFDAPSLFLAVYDPRLSFQTALTAGFTSLHIFDPGDDVQVELHPRLRELADGRSAYDYFVRINGLPLSDPKPAPGTDLLKMGQFPSKRPSLEFLESFYFDSLGLELGLNFNCDDGNPRTHLMSCLLGLHIRFPNFERTIIRRNQRMTTLGIAAFMCAVFIFVLITNLLLPSDLLLAPPLNTCSPLYDTATSLIEKKRKKMQAAALPLRGLWVEWNCTCGRIGSDEFQNLGAYLEALEGITNLAHGMVASGYTTNARVSSKPSNVINNLRRIANNTIVSTRNRIAGLRSPILPIGRTQSSPQPSEYRCLQSTQCRWVHLCIKQGPYATKLEPLHCCKEKKQEDYNDTSFFQALRTTYFSQRSWKDRLLFTLKRIDFVEFKVWPESMVDHILHDRIPPSTTNYDFLPPPPPKLVPPIGSSHMMHLLTSCPSAPSNTSFYIQRIPKKKDNPLTFDGTSPSEDNTGWGLHFVETVNRSLLVNLMFGISTVLGILFAICWTVLKKDIQGAFGVAAYITSVVTLAVMAWQSWSV